MLENPTPTLPDSNTTVVKRYAPPNQRNRSLNRRKSGERFDRSNNSFGDEKNHPVISRNVPIMDHGDAGGSIPLNDNPRPLIIALEGCGRSQASQLLNERWEAAIHLYNDTSIDLSERPVMYSGGSNTPAWGALRLPHQIMSSSNSVGPSSGAQIDFLAELSRAMRSDH